MNGKTNEKVYAIIVAAGTGKRMNSTVKKQYMEIASQPVLGLTLKAFEESKTDEIVVVTGADDIAYVREQIVEDYMFKKVSAICGGGKERCDSVYEGLKLLIRKHPDTVESSYVLIHDGVRPLITPKLIDQCIENVKKCGACVPAVPEKDTVKMINADGEIDCTLDRKKVYRIQTPQCFEMGLIKEAFEKYYSETDSNGEDGSHDAAAVTDDAMLVEKYTGHKVRIVEGDYRNIKITTPEDIEIAEFYLAGNEKQN